jgi:hypothetical protein
MSVNLDTFAYSFPHPDGFTFLNKFCASDWTLKKSMKLALKMMRFLAHADGVGFETIRNYLTINFINDLCCDVLPEIATTCDYAVTNCHGDYFPHSQFRILAKSPSRFEIKIISIRPTGFSGFGVD